MPVGGSLRQFSGHPRRGGINRGGLEARREQASKPLPLERIDVVGPETLTGSDIARIWTEVLDRQVVYGRDADVRHRLRRAPFRRSGSVQDD